MYKLWVLVTLIFLVQAIFLQAQDDRKYDSFKFSNATYNYAYFVPSEYDTSRVFPAVIGPGDGTNGSDNSFFWNTGDPGSFGWILIEFSLWKQNSNVVEALIKELNAKFKVEGDKFHIVGFSANSSSAFSHAISNPQYFHSVTGIPGQPSSRNNDQLTKLNGIRIQNIVGEKDVDWLNSAREFDSLYRELGLSSSLEIIPNGDHGLKQLAGKDFMDRMERMRK